jgi:hypothetical protein
VIKQLFTNHLCSTEDGAPDFDSYMENFENHLADYIPPRNTWTPADEALFLPRDLYRFPLAEAEEMRFKAISYTFNHHYQHNQVYRGFCQENGVAPADLKGPQDLSRIPLIRPIF